jgi:hypothetical protein
MKTIILLSMFSFSGLALSEVIPAGQKNDVIQAIKDSLKSKDLDCVGTDEGRDIKLKASALNLDAVLFSAELKINENVQPAIVFHADYSRHSWDSTLEVYTNSDFSVVEKIKASHYGQPTTSTTRKNVGTILNPKYETITITIKGKLVEQVECN